MFAPISKNNILPDVFLECDDWADFQFSLGRKTWKLDKNNFLIKYVLPFKKSYLYVPRGPIDVNLKEFISKTKEIAKKEDSFFLKVEPPLESSEDLTNFLVESGFIKVKETQPETTSVINLTLSEKELLKNMDSNTRYAVRAAQKKGVMIYENKNKFASFWNLFKTTEKKHHLTSYGENYYRNLLKLDKEIKTKLFYAEIDNEVITAAIILYFRKTAYYLYAASKDGFGKYNAPSLLLYEVILDAKKNNYEFFDLWGISHINPKWQGITHFKRGFGGREIHYVGTWEYVFDKKWYYLYKLAKKIV